MSSLRGLLEGLVNLVFPGAPGCPLCAGGREPVPCPACREAMRVLSGQAHCACCGRFFRGPAPAPPLCLECRPGAWPFERCRAYGPYEGVLRDAVHRLKYGGRRDLAALLGELMARSVRRLPVYTGADFLVPVPLARETLQRRGFNQADLLAGAAARELGIPVHALLAKVRRTPAQAGLSRAERLTNLTATFALAGTAAAVRGRTVVVVDDVFTTGSTLSAAARVLVAAGAARVLGLVFVAGRN